MKKDLTKAGVYVAYNRRTGNPWAAGIDRDAIFDYAEENDLVVIDVSWIGELP